MATKEDDLWRYYRWLDEQQRIKMSDREVSELREALGAGDGTPDSQARMRQVFCRQEEARLAQMRSRHGNPFAKPPFTQVKK